MTVGTQPVWNKDVGSINLAAHASSKESTEADALLQFSDISRKFIDSYSHLEKHIDHLSSELAAQTAEKENQFIEKKKLADRLERILATLPSAVVVIDGHGRIQETNALAENMLGTTIIGKTWLTVISEAFAPQSDDGHEISLKDGRRVKVETKALGSEPGQVILLTDLTETRNLQEHQSREQRLSVIGKMMASLAHQIRTPLSSALLYSGHISSQKLDEQRQQRFHSNLQHSLKQLERQVSDMLLFASGGVSSKKKFKLSELIISLKADINNYISTKKVDITVEDRRANSSDKEISLFGNKQSLLGAIANLTENSFHACRNNGSRGRLTDISISIEDNDERSILISVNDNGCGISENDKNQIFQPFYTTRAKGTGLGLAVVNTVINSFKGRVDIKSELAKGTSIRLVLPCIQSDSFNVIDPLTGGQ